MEGLWQKGKSLWGRFSVVNANTHASSIAYFAYFSLVPVLALCISLVSLTGVNEQDVATFFMALVPDALDEVVEALIDDAFDSSGIAFSLSTLTLLWSASKGIKALRNGLNVTYGVQESRNAVAVIAISIVAVVILGVLVAAVMYLVFSDSVLHAIAKIASGLQQQQSTILSILNPIVMVASGVLILGVCYAYLPAGTRSLVAQLPGAAFAVLACGVLSYGFRVYIDNFSNSTVLYGSIATLAMLLAWMYLVSFILLIGGFINRVLSEGTSEDEGEGEQA